MNDDKFIRNQIQKILQEKSKKEDGMGSRRGRLLVTVEDAARAKLSPQELLSNLGVKQAQGDKIEDKVFSVLEAAIANINSKDDLKGAFSGPVRSKNNNIIVRSGNASDEDTARYVGHILYAAHAAGLISDLDKTVKVDGRSGGALVQFENVQ